MATDVECGNVGLKYNPYPDNHYCVRPKDSPMRKWCNCLQCRKYAKEVADAKKSSHTCEKQGNK